jgi:enterochelin esterase family protein
MPFTRQIIEDVIPMVDANYRTIPDREHRAMAGLSLGGTQTYTITQANLDKFAAIGIFSAPFGFPGVETGYNGLLTGGCAWGNNHRRGCGDGGGGHRSGGHRD